MLAASSASFLSAEANGKTGVQLVVKEADRRVDVLVDGKPFTSYIWPTTLKKPVLYPLRTSAGTVVTRGFPLEPRPGERVDHPHHVGLWLNHGDVNGFDFWNNSDAIPAKDAAKYGTIVHRAIKSAKSGADKGELQVTEDWTTPDGKTLLREDTTYVFRAGAGLRSIDRITTLTALDQKVTFHDSKEGMIGMRVARELEQPSDKAEIFTDASGKATAVAKLDNTGVSRELHEQRGQDGRCGLGHARALDDALGQDRQRAHHARHPRSSEEPDPPDLLARTRLRPVRREPVRGQGLHGREGGDELRAGARAVGDAQAPRADPLRPHHRGPARGAVQALHATR